MSAVLDFGASGDAVADMDGRKPHFPGRGDASGVEGRGRHGAGENGAAKGRFSIGAEACIECRFFAFKGAGELARHGFGNCAHEPKWRYQSATFPRHCPTFAPALDTVVEPRVRWLNDQKTNQRRA